MKKKQLLMRPLWVLFFLGTLATLVALIQDHRARNPLLLQRNPNDDSVMKVVPVYHDEREKDAHERLVSSIECAPYDILDEGTYSGVFSGSYRGDSYYLYIRYRCQAQTDRK